MLPSPTLHATPAPLVGVVVLNWRQPDASLHCLASVAASTHRNVRVYFVDNGSGDDSVERVRSRFPEAAILETGANLGYAAGNNHGIKRALQDGCHFVLVLNNDAALEPDCIDHLVSAAARHPAAGLFQPLILRRGRDGAFALPVAWSTRRRGFTEREADTGTGEDIVRVAYAAGSALFARSAVLRTTGGFDTRYFLCWEEIDLAWRARRLGWQAVMVRSARADHEGQLSFGGRDTPLRAYFNRRNRLMWARRHLGLRERWRLYVSEGVHAARLLGRSLVGARGERQARDRAVLAAYRDAILQRTGDGPPWLRTM